MEAFSHTAVATGRLFEQKYPQLSIARLCLCIQLVKLMQRVQCSKHLKLDRKQSYAGCSQHHATTPFTSQNMLTLTVYT